MHSSKASHQVRKTSVVATLLLVACGANSDAQQSSELDTLEERVNFDGDVGPAPATTQQPAFVNCSALAEYKTVKLSALDKDATYKRPDNCPGWSGLEAQFTVPASLPYRKLYVTANLNYAGQSNAKAKCLASKIEYETFRQVNVGSTAIWLPFSQASVTPIWSDSSEICYWHNFNSGLTSSPPGTYVERIRTRGIRYNGTIVNTFANARMQADTIP
jgi:hypothetical protein